MCGSSRWATRGQLPFGNTGETLDGNARQAECQTRAEGTSDQMAAFLHV